MTLYDFHLHWYPGYQINRFAERLQQVAGNYSTLVGVVYDTELVDCWSELSVAWQFLPLENTEQTDSRLYGELEETGARVALYRGVQAISEENIELLVLGDVPETGPLSSVVSEALAKDSVVILPWGFGKWRGHRGKIILRELEVPRPGLFAADSGNRPNRGIGEPLLKGAFRNLQPGHSLDGSDPLPMEGDEVMAFSLGRKGPDIDDLPPDSIALAKMIRSIGHTLEPFDSPRPTMDSLRRQWRLRANGFPLRPPPRPAIPGVSDAGDIESATDRYARRFGGSVGSYFLARQAQLTLELADLENHPPGEVLDIGGGHAQLAPHFLAQGWSVSIFASDESCRRRPDRLLGSDNYRFATGDLLHLPYPDDSFDVVTVFRLVTHETDWETLIAEAARVARKAVILDYPDLRSFNVCSRVLFLVKKAIEKDTREYAVFTRRKIAAAMQEAGLVNLHWKPQFFLPMAFYRLAGSGRLAASLEAGFSRIGLTSLFGSPVIVGGYKK